MMTATAGRTPCEKRIYILPSNVATSHFQDTKNLVISRCCFAENGKEMHQDSKRTCTVIVPLIKPFVWCRYRHRRRRAKTPYCSVRDWTRFLRHSDKKISGFTRPHVIGFVADIFFSTLESVFILFRIRCRIRRIRVDGSRIRNEKVADSKISGYV